MHMSGALAGMTEKLPSASTGNRSTYTWWSPAWQSLGSQISSMMAKSSEKEFKKKKARIQKGMSKS